LFDQFNQAFERGRDGSRLLAQRPIMSSIATVNGLKSKSVLAIAVSVVLPVIVGSLALAEQDRYTLKIPNGLAWSEFRGYETWQNVAVSQTETSLKVIAANDVMINAYRVGVPGDGKLFPDGSKVTKIEWSFKKNDVSPYFVNVPGTLKTVAFIEKDTKRFPDTHGWAYAQWAYDSATDTFKPSELDPSGAECGFACHTKVSAQDYIFTAYPKR
jgi:hypothetical protein